MAINKTWSMKDLDNVFPESKQEVIEPQSSQVEMAQAASKPLYHNSKIKAALLLGGGTCLAVVAVLMMNVFGDKSPEKVVATAPETAQPTTPSNDGWEMAAKQSTSDAGQAINIPEPKKSDSPVSPSPSPSTATAKTTPNPSVSPPVAPSATASTSPKPAVRPAPSPVFQTASATYSRPTRIPAVTPVAGKVDEAKLKALEAKIDKLATAFEGHNTRPRASAIAKPTAVAAAPTPIKAIAPIKTAQVEKEPIAQPQIQQVAQMTTPIINGRVEGQLFDPLTVSAANNINGSQGLVRIQLKRAMPTTSGLEIPAGSIVAMQIVVASNGMVSGSSTGVWDTLTQKQLSVPVGALVMEGLNGSPLIAQSIKANDAGAQTADTQVAIWNAIGSGVDGLTRPDSNSSISAGTIVTTATSGGSRDILVNAAGGFAKSKAGSLEKQAASDRDKISKQSEMWHLPRNTEIIVSTRPPSFAAEASGNQYRQNSQQQYQPYQSGNYQRQYQQLNNYQFPPYQTEAPPPSRYAVNPNRR